MNQLVIFYLSLTKLLQLLSRLRLDTHALDVEQNRGGLRGGLESHDLRYTSLIFGLYFHAMNSQLKGRSDDHEYDMCIY